MGPYLRTILIIGVFGAIVYMFGLTLIMQSAILNGKVVVIADPTMQVEVILLMAFIGTLVLNFIYEFKQLLGDVRPVHPGSDTASGLTHPLGERAQSDERRRHDRPAAG